MSVVRRIARPLLAAPFIVNGVRTVVRPERVVDGLPVAMADLDKQVAKTAIPTDAANVLRISGGVAAVAGAAFALNRAPRVSALALVATSALTLGGRRKIWELEGKERFEELAAVATDLGLIGGVLLAAVDTDGNPSLKWRAGQAVEQVQTYAERKQKDLAKVKKAAERSKAAHELDKKIAKKINAI